MVMIVVQYGRVIFLLKDERFNLDLGDRLVQVLAYMRKIKTEESGGLICYSILKKHFHSYQEGQAYRSA